jgi:hypothetical protein
MLQSRHLILATALAGLACASLAEAQVTISVDAASNQRPIDPRIYGIHFGSAGQLSDLNATMNRYGGNSSGRYNWTQNIDNRGVDFFFESIPYADPTPGALGDSFILNTKNGGAEPFETLPMVDYIAKTDAGRNTLWSFSVAKYGPQCSSDGDAGDGLLGDCATFLVGNDPNDASTPNSSAIEQGWAQHIKDTFGPAATTGLKYWGYDNEPSIWFQAYRDVTPPGKHDTEMLSKMIDYGSQIRATDPGVTLLGPEEWGWDPIFFSGFDQQTNAACGYCGNFPDHDMHGDYVAYLLDQLRQYETDTGTRLLDVYSQHFYPQGTEYYPDSNASDVPTELLRNRSTRGLWDPNYLNESYIADFVQLIPRMRSLRDTHYPGIKVGLTEYNWGGDFLMNGATVQADVLGILGREGADIGIRWDTNGFVPGMPPYQAFKLYRNYDGAKSTFGDTSVLASVPDADTVASFAARRSSDGALTVMVINKNLSGSVTVNVNIASFNPGPTAQAYQVAGAGTSISHLADVAVAGNVLSTTVPGPSVTLFVIPTAVAPTPSLSIADTAVDEGNAGASNASFQVTLSAPSASQVTVDFATADGTATAADNDYVATSGTLTIPAGQTTGQILVQVNGDTAVEPNETFLVNLSAPTNATIADGQGIGTIVNDDTPTIWLSIADTTLPEGNAGTTNAQFQVSLSMASGSDVTVQYATADGTATAGSDYVASSGTLTIPAGLTSGQILVPVNGDTDVEGDETFMVNLSAANGATIADGQAVGTILNDDVAGPNISIAGVTVSEAAGTANFMVTADAPAPAPITFIYSTTNGTAAAGFDYDAVVGGSGTILMGQTTTTVPVTIINDGLAEPDENFLVTLNGASGGQIANATAEGVIQDDDGGLMIPEINHGSDLHRDFSLSSEALYRITQQPYSSYEVVVDSLSGDVTPIALDLLAPDYSVLASAGPAGAGFDRSLRLDNGANANSESTRFVRVRSGGCVNTCTTDERYRLRVFDTTYRIARFNNSASQVTLVILRNQGNAAVNGHVTLFNATAFAGSAFTIPAQGTFILNTATLLPGASGSISVANDGAYGQLAGKAVSVEPATGFTFDTAMEPRPR